VIFYFSKLYNLAPLHIDIYRTQPDESRSTYNLQFDLGLRTLLFDKQQEHIDSGSVMSDINKIGNDDESEDFSIE